MLITDALSDNKNISFIVLKKILFIEKEKKYGKEK